MINIRKHNKGFTLIEIIIATFIIVLVIRASIVFNEPLRLNLKQLETRFTAINLASSQIEDLEEIAKTDFVSGLITIPGPATLQTLSVGTGKVNTLQYAGLDWNDVQYIANGYLTYDVTTPQDPSVGVSTNGSWTEANPNPNPSFSDTDVDYKIISVTCEYDVPFTTPAQKGEVQMIGFVVEPVSD